MSIFLICFMFMSTFAIGQKTITGKVTDSNDKSPLVGVTVVVKGTTNGTVTNIDGYYSLKAESNSDVLVYSYIGYTTKEVTINNQSTIDILLAADNMQVGEVVIVGYGSQKKENLTGAVSMVTAEDLEKSNSSDVARALQGRASGVSIMSTSGRPGSTMNIRVRGVGSIANNAQPLVIIDGVNTSTGALNNLNPNDIESISILKDAASAAIYGAQSSNGVILVRTKKGKAGAPKMQFSVKMGLSQLPKRMEIMNSEEYIDFYTKAYDSHNKRYVNPGLQRYLPIAYGDSARAAFGNADTDWQNLITNEQAWSQNYYMGISGGTDKATYNISANYINEKGVLITTFRDLVNFRVNTSIKINDFITFGENFAFNVNNSQQEGTGNAWRHAAISSPIMPVYDANALKGFMGPVLGSLPAGQNDVTNPYAELLLNEDTQEGFGVIGDAYLEIKLIKGLKYRSNLAINYSASNRTQWTPKYDLGVRSVAISSLAENMSMFRHIQFDNTLNYTNNFGAHNISILAGHSVIDDFAENLTGSGSDFTWESLQTVQNGNPDNNTSTQYKTPLRLQSFFARATYDYAGKYLLQLVMRRDGSSRFGASRRYGNFPSASAGWKINEDLMQNIDEIDLLKIRVGYGLTGALPDGNFLYDGQISTYNDHVYTLGASNRAVYGAAPFYNYGSPTISWETAKMSNIGIDLNAFNNKIQFSGEYYLKKIEDLLSSLPLQAIYGLSEDAAPPTVNIGNIENKGFEFNLTYNNREGKLKYSINANLTTVKNQVTYLVEDEQFSSNGFAMAKMGHSVGSYFGYVAERILTEEDFLHDETTGELIISSGGAYTSLVPDQEAFTGPGDIKFKDLNDDGKITTLDQTIIGKIIPDFTYGMNMDFEYKNFDLNIFFQGVQNVDMYNQYMSSAAMSTGDATSHDWNKLKIAGDYWTQDNQVEGRTGISLTDNNDNDRLSSWWIEDASFLRLKTLQLGYTLPQSVLSEIGIGYARIYIGGENLLTFTNYTGYDPEISNVSPLSGVSDNGNYPVPRTFSFGININF
ncbi:MAG: SusC/RagA family TonB-linked outer membrane protein [Prolixibacteraceae bacterium]